jgi:hypothetical protein
LNRLKDYLEKEFFIELKNIFSDKNILDYILGRNDFNLNETIYRLK